MLDWSNCIAVERSQERVSGAWVFKGTRLPVKALFENLEEGASVDDFLEWFPGPEASPGGVESRGKKSGYSLTARSSHSMRVLFGQGTPHSGAHYPGIPWRQLMNEDGLG